MKITCAIHQPNFFPWLGYFDKIQKADIFVFLDDTQNSKTGSSWVNRVQLNAFGEGKWCTCPIKRPSGVVSINQVEFADPQWRTRLLNVLKSYYGNHDNFKDGISIISELINAKEYSRIADLNKDVVAYFCRYFGLSTRLLSKSDLGVTSHATKMLVDICRQVGADTYLCGGGAAGYQEDEVLRDNGIHVAYQNYEPQVYGKPDQYLPGLSLIDYVMSVR